MKILVVSSGYPPAACGGYELACRDVAEELVRRGHVVRVLASPAVLAGGRPVAAPGDVETVGGVSVSRALSFTLDPAARPLTARRWDLWIRANTRALRGEMARFGPDVVYAWNLSGTGALGLLRVAAGAPRGVAVHLMDYWLSDLVATSRGGRPRFHPLARPFLRAALGVVRALASRALARGVLIAMTRTVADVYGEAGLATTVVRHGVRVGELPAVRTPGRGDGLKLVVLGRLIRGKGAHVALEAVARLASRGLKVELDVIGDGDASYRAELEALRGRLGLGDSVRLKGALDHASALAGLAGYDVLVFPTLRNEPMGIVVLEAMAAGVAVVSSAIGGPTEVFDDGRNGLLVPPGDPRALADAIGRLADSPELLARVRSEAHRDVRSTHTLERSVDEIERILAGM